MLQKNVLFYSNTGLSSKQIGLTYEVLAKLQSDKNLNLFIVLCDNELHNCYFNRSHNTLGCISCQSRLLKVLDIANISSKNIYKLKFDKQSTQESKYIFKDLNELTTFTYKNLEVGRGVASSIVSYTRDFIVNSDKYGDLIALELDKAIKVSDYFMHFIREKAIDEIYLFNGRFSEVYPLVELAKNFEIPFNIIESGTTTNFEIYKNSLPHSIQYTYNSMIANWESSQDENKIDIAKSWFELRRKGSEQFQISFTKNQTKGLIPDLFDKSKVNIAIFNSSEDEMKVIPEWIHDLYNYQNEAIIKLVDYYKDNNKFHFYLRIHPNLMDVKNNQVKELLNLKYSNLTIIPSNSKIDTYTLIDICDKVLSFGSTVGIEASYWDRPSILFGNSFYKNLDCTYNPNNFEELVALINELDLKAKDKSTLLIYGYYFSNFGKESKNIRFKDGKIYSINNERLRNFHLNSLKLIFKYFLNFKQWLKAHKIIFGESLNFRNFSKYK